jgi:hypothetical protein
LAFDVEFRLTTAGFESEPAFFFVAWAPRPGVVPDAQPVPPDGVVFLKR